MKILNVEIKDEAHKKLKVIAAKESKNMSTIIEELIDARAC